MSFDLKIENGDLKIASNGDLEQIENTEKLIQDILKICVTPLGANIFFPWYGSQVSRSMVGSALSPQFITSIATSQLRNALETLQKMQDLQLKSGQSMTAEEMLAAIKAVLIQQNQTDPRYFQVVIQVLTRALSVTGTSFEIRL